MNYFRSCTLISSVLFLFLWSTQAEELASSGVPTPPSPVSLMTDKEKVGQLFIVGFEGTDISPMVKSHFEDLRPGGVLLFRKNLKSKQQLRALTTNLQATQKTYLFIAVDQEGGVVTRIPTKPKMPSAAWIGRKNRPDLTEKLGFHMGRILQSYGINMNLAPVLDVSGGKTSFLRSRAFSENPEAVAEQGAAFSRGLLQAGVLPTAKHFPGLGSIDGDPHKESVKVSSTYKQVISRDIVPFKKFSSITPSAIMLSHASYPSLDPNLNPATFSSRISSEILRKEVGFEGLVITDDLLMEGAATTAKFENRLIKALISGTDMLLFAWSPKTQKRAQAAILTALENGTLSKSWLNKRVEKILEIKDLIHEKQKVRSLASDPETDYKNLINELISVTARRGQLYLGR